MIESVVTRWAILRIDEEINVLGTEIREALASGKPTVEQLNLIKETIGNLEAAEMWLEGDMKAADRLSKSEFSSSFRSELETVTARLQERLKEFKTERLMLAAAHASLMGDFKEVADVLPYTQTAEGVLKGDLESLLFGQQTVSAVMKQVERIERRHRNLRAWCQQNLGTSDDELEAICEGKRAR